MSKFVFLCTALLGVQAHATLWSCSSPSRTLQTPKGKGTVSTSFVLADGDPDSKWIKNYMGGSNLELWSHHSSGDEQIPMGFHAITKTPGSSEITVEFDAPDNGGHKVLKLDTEKLTAEITPLTRNLDFSGSYLCKNSQENG